MCCSCREPEEWFCYVTKIFKEALTFRILPCFLFQGVEQRKEMVESKEQWSWGWAQIKLLKFPILSSDRSSLINSFFLGWICTLHHPEKPGVSRCANLLGGKRSKMSSQSKLFSTCFYFIPIPGHISWKSFAGRREGEKVIAEASIASTSTKVSSKVKRAEGIPSNFSSWL